MNRHSGRETSGAVYNFSMMRCANRWRTNRMLEETPSAKYLLKRTNEQFTYLLRRLLENPPPRDDIASLATSPSSSLIIAYLHVPREGTSNGWRESNASRYDSKSYRIAITLSFALHRLFATRILETFHVSLCSTRVKDSWQVSGFVASYLVAY